MKLKPGTPQDIVDNLQFLGHVAISLITLLVAVDAGRASLPPAVHPALRDAGEAVGRLSAAVMAAELDRLTP